MVPLVLIPFSMFTPEYKQETTRLLQGIIWCSVSQLVATPRRLPQSLRAITKKFGIREGDEVPNMGIYFGDMIEKYWLIGYEIRGYTSLVDSDSEW